MEPACNCENEPGIHGACGGDEIVTNPIRAMLHNGADEMWGSVYIPHHIEWGGVVYQREGILYVKAHGSARAEGGNALHYDRGTHTLAPYMAVRPSWAGDALAACESALLAWLGVHGAHLYRFDVEMRADVHNALEWSFTGRTTRTDGRMGAPVNARPNAHGTSDRC